MLEAALLAPSEAIAFFRQKGLVSTERYGEVMNEAHSRGFAVAGATSDALLRDLKAAVNSAITDGTTLKDFQKSFDQIVKKHGWDHGGDAGWRAKIIYDTNLSTAYAAGQYAQMATPEARDIFPAWRYIHHACPHPRAEHVAWDGLVLANDDPWWNTHFPPNGWRCHCTVEPVTRSDMRRNKWQITDAPPLDLRPWKNPATGKTEMVPKGIDPSFAYNPGKAWQDHQAAKATVQPKLEPRTHIGSTPVHHVPAAVREKQQAEDIIQLLKPEAQGEVTAATLPQNVQTLLGSETPDVLLSRDMLGKNPEKHSDMDGLYPVLPQLVNKPSIVFQGNTERHLKLLSDYKGKTYSIIVKRTHDRLHNYIVSFQRLRMQELKRLFRQRSPLLGVREDLPEKD
nr:phage minor head protein [Neokomagataea anthophila]